MKDPPGAAKHPAKVGFEIVAALEEVSDSLDIVAKVHFHTIAVGFTDYSHRAGRPPKWVTVADPIDLKGSHKASPTRKFARNIGSCDC
jgi:hypothetical protein